ncbi:MAG: cysteine desulfurase-like protein [Candidatus Aminicenantes bacterium]|nr:cysteine desulfurase-like protein [Candidatus Aminicenantes bacterium]
MNNIFDRVREQFPALASGIVFLDGPGGTQVPQAVMDAVSTYYREANSNEHGLFSTSRRSDAIIAKGREAMADFIHARSPNEIVFGTNMTTLTLHLSRALGRDLGADDEVVVTRLDHDANIAPWLHLQEQGVVIRWLEFDAADCTLKLEDLEKTITKRTRLLAVGGASNAFGTVNDLPRILAAARAANVLTFVDAVHYAPHRPIDVQLLNCDFLACSPYKFYGPHSGVLYGRREVLEQLDPFKVRPAADSAPDRFETGTKSHEAIAGVAAAIDFLAALGQELGTGCESYPAGRRRLLKQALAAISDHESSLFARLLAGLKEIPGVRIYGITDPRRLRERTPTACFTLSGKTPAEVASRLGDEGIHVWDGDYYAWEAMRHLGLGDRGGAVRAGLSLYNSAGEVELFLDALRRLAQ